ncbi:MAG: FAD/NAD(P)-binding protein [Thermodesulfovibrionales bacterium]
MKNNSNIYMPVEAAIQDVRALSADVKLYTLKTEERFRFKPGQFFMVSVFGYGEAPISVASLDNGHLQLCIRKAGLVTGAIHALRPGDRVGIRGPYGNGFSLDVARGRDVVIVAGGLGIVPLRPLIYAIVARRKDFGRISLLYGSRRPSEILFGDEAEVWGAEGVKVVHTVDCSEGGWQGCVGIVTGHLDKIEADFPESAAYICGPNVMIDAAMRSLSNLGIPDDRIITTLEAHMKCGVGKCGHCYRGAKYLCTDGPVFSLRELKTTSLP